jgi:hypothetical protein
MAMATTSHPEDSRIVLREVVTHLSELGDRIIADPLELTEAWTEVHRCDDAAMDALDPGVRHTYDVVTRSRSRRSRRIRSSVVEDRVVVLHLAVHRRLVILTPLVEI